MEDKKIIEINLPGGGKVWADAAAWEIEKKFMQVQHELMELHIWSGYKATEEQVRAAYKRHGLAYTPPDPFQLDTYFIITDKGLMARDRKTGKDYKVKEDYSLEPEPYSGEYIYIRNARPMDI